MNAKRFMDPAQVFALHPRPRIRTRVVGESKIKVVTVDQFYRDPQRVRAFFFSMPAPIWKTGPGSKNYRDYCDARHSLSLPYRFSHVTERIADLVKEHFGHDVSFPTQAVSNVFQLLKPQPAGTTAFPHSDAHPDPSMNQPVNALVYLNRGRELRGGTAFYRHIETGRETIPMTPAAFHRFIKKHIEIPGNMENGSSYWCEYTKYWEKFHLCEMRFNRLVIFPSQVFHGAWHEPGWFNSYPRINQVFFSSPSV